MNTLTNLELKASLRIIDRAGEHWFVAKDVCQALGLENHHMALRRLDEDEKGVNQIDTRGGPQKMAVVSESGLYALILRSDKPNARAFRRWVTSEVLPQIRKTGSYGWEIELSRLEREFRAAQELLDETRGKIQAFRKNLIGRASELPTLPTARRAKPRIDYVAEVKAMPLPCVLPELLAWCRKRWPGVSAKAAEMRIWRMRKRGILARDAAGKIIPNTQAPLP